MVGHGVSIEAIVSISTLYFARLRASIQPGRHAHRSRFWEIDVLRGVAVAMMVVYHLLWDLQGLGGFEIDVYIGFWHSFQIITASLFICLLGISLALSYDRLRARNTGDSNLFTPFLVRGLVVFSWGIVVGIVTFFVDPGRYVRFGILHFMGVAIVFAYPFLHSRWLALGAALFLLLVAPFTYSLGLRTSWLTWLGLDASPRAAFDYYPVIPWFAVVLIGIFLGSTFYGSDSRGLSVPSSIESMPMRGLRLLGQNSLLIYLVHQPILIALLTVTGIIRM